MNDPTRDFFSRLDERAQKVLPSTAGGTVRVDLTSGNRVDHWFLTIDKGHVRVSREDRDADCVVRTDKLTFDQLTEGAANIGALLFRTQVTITGSLAHLGYLRRLLPGSPTARDPRAIVRERPR